MRCGQNASSDIFLCICFSSALNKADFDSEKEECLLCRNQLSVKAATSHRDSVQLYLNVAFIQDPAQPTLYPECI